MTNTKQRTIEEIDEQIASLHKLRAAMLKQETENREREGLAKIAKLKEILNNTFAEMDRVAREYELGYISYEGPAGYGSGVNWTESSGWESSSASC